MNKQWLCGNFTAEKTLNAQWQRTRDTNTSFTTIKILPSSNNIKNNQMWHELLSLAQWLLKYYFYSSGMYDNYSHFYMQSSGCDAVQLTWHSTTQK
jgi:hypothetical protein